MPPPGTGSPAFRLGGGSRQGSQNSHVGPTRGSVFCTLLFSRGCSFKRLLLANLKGITKISIDPQEFDSWPNRSGDKTVNLGLPPLAPCRPRGQRYAPASTCKQVTSILTSLRQQARESHMWNSGQHRCPKYRVWSANCSSICT